MPTEFIDGVPESVLPHSRARAMADAARVGVIEFPTLRLVETPRGGAFDRIGKLARRMFEAPLVLLALPDADCVWLGDRSGCTETRLAGAQVPCALVYQTGDVVVVADALDDPLFQHAPISIGGESLRSFAGRVIRGSDGTPLGMLGVFDSVPRTWSSLDGESLDDLAALVEQQLAHSVAAARLEREGAERRRFETLARCAPVGVFSTDADGTCDYVNQAIGHIAQASRRTFSSHSWLELVHPDDRERVEATWQRATKTQTIFEEVCRVERPRGQVRWVQFKAAPVFDQGQVVAWVGFAEDVTEARAIQAALVESETRFQQLANSSDEVFWITDTESHRVLYVSPAYERVWKRSVKSILENPWDWLEAIHPEDRDRAQRAFASVLEGDDSFEVEFRITLPDGSIRHVLDRGFPVRDESGRVIRMAGVAADVTELTRARETLRTMAETDDLTGALNSRAFRRLLKHELARGVRERRPVAVALLDIDNFKLVNDEHGHLAGDAVLTHVVSVLRGRLRASDIVARLGGDEFCVVLPNAEETGAIQVLSELSSEISRVRVPLGGGRAAAVTMSIGIAISTSACDEVELLKRADDALYRSKREGRNRVSVAPEPERAIATA